jgi:hypothetical protein
MMLIYISTILKILLTVYKVLMICCRTSVSVYLRLPELSHGVPDSDLARGRQCHELRADVEQLVDSGVQVEGAHVHAARAQVLGEADQADKIAVANCKHCADLKHNCSLKEFGRMYCIPSCYGGIYDVEAKDIYRHHFG